MSREQTLFEKLRNPKINALRTISENTEELAESVLRHLQKMLNTRQGHTLIQPDYGMPDFTEFKHLLPDAVNEMQYAIKNTIEKYEPRLRNVNVSFIPETEEILNIHFEITAELVTTKEEASVWFKTSIDSSGHIDIR